MKLFRITLIVIVVFINNNLLLSQEESYVEDSTETLEVYLIDNYLQSEKEKILVLSWMTNLPVKSKVEIEDIGTFNVSDTLTDFHQTKIDLGNVKFTKNEYYFRVISELENGKLFVSEDYSFIVPFEGTDTSTHLSTTSSQIKTSGSYYIYNFALGITLWLLPSPALVLENNKTKFAILKDLPLVSIGSSSAYKTFPYVYFYTGYLHIPEGTVKNSFRLGSKYLYEIPGLKHFISLGLGGFTNFKSSNGISGEIGFSFLRVLKTFEMTVSYSYNYIPSSKNKFHLFSIGLFTSSFSINLNY